MCALSARKTRDAVMAIVHALQFLAKFIMKREGMNLLRPEFQPKALRASMHDESFKAALSKEGFACPSPVTSVAAPAALTNVHERLRESPIKEVAEKGEMQLCSERASSPASDLSRHLARWFMDEVEVGYSQDVASEIKRQVWGWADYHRRTTVATNVRDVIAECRPDNDGSRAYDMINFYSEWGAKWLLALNPDVSITFGSVQNGESAGSDVAHGALINEPDLTSQPFSAKPWRSRAGTRSMLAGYPRSWCCCRIRRIRLSMMLLGKVQKGGVHASSIAPSNE